MTRFEDALEYIKLCNKDNNDPKLTEAANMLKAKIAELEDNNAVLLPEL